MSNLTNSSKETLKDQLNQTNELISKFMKSTNIENYSNSWDSLIPVCERISILVKELRDSKEDIRKYYYNYIGERLDTFMVFSDNGLTFIRMNIEDVYRGVTRFVKWYSSMEELFTNK